MDRGLCLVMTFKLKEGSPQLVKEAARLKEGT